MSPRYATDGSEMDHNYIRPDASVSRSPCPGLNALANQGYVARNGTNLSFWCLLHAIRHVYNLSFPLAFLLTFFGFLTCGKISFAPLRSQEDNLGGSLVRLFPSLRVLPTWTLDLSSLSARGFFKIAHNASLVHPDDIPSMSPDPALLRQLIQLASTHEGLTLEDLGRLRNRREASLKNPLHWLHEQVSFGECGLAWSVMREKIYEIPTSSHSSVPNTKEESLEHYVIPLSRLQQWFGEERLPDDWWNGARPEAEIGLFQARRCAERIEKMRDPLVASSVSMFV